MQRKESEDPHSSSNCSDHQDRDLSLIKNLSLTHKSRSGSSLRTKNEVEQSKKTKLIEKSRPLRRRYNRDPSKKNQSGRKKMQKMERTIESLSEQLEQLKRKVQSCHNCSSSMPQELDKFAAYTPNYDEEMKKIAGDFQERRLSRGSHGSVQFENVNFHAPVLFSKEMDDRAWVYLGTVMIAMGSKCVDFDGTLNIFKILKQSVDTLRRQVEKSDQNISMDFYTCQEDMQSTEQPNLYMEEIGYDPFTQKLGNTEGLCLEGVKVESVEQFDLIFDNKLTFNLKYEALLGAMEYLRENSWVTF